MDEVYLDRRANEVSSSAQSRQRLAYEAAKKEDMKKNIQLEKLRSSQSIGMFLSCADSHSKLTLLYGAHDTEHNNAVVLRDYLYRKSRH